MILDEPFRGLDAHVAPRLMQEYFAELLRGAAAAPTC